MELGVLNGAVHFANYLNKPRVVGRTIARVLEFPAEVVRGFQAERAHSELLKKIFPKGEGGTRLRLIRLDGLSEIEASWIKESGEEDVLLAARALAERDIVNGTFQEDIYKGTFGYGGSRKMIDDVIISANHIKKIGDVIRLATRNMVEEVGDIWIVQSSIRGTQFEDRDCKVYSSGASVVGNDLRTALRNMSRCPKLEDSVMTGKICETNGEFKPAGNYCLIETEKHILYLERDQRGELTVISLDVRDRSFMSNELGAAALSDRRDNAAPNQGLLLMQSLKYLNQDDLMAEGSELVAAMIQMMEGGSWIYVADRYLKGPVLASRLLARINHGSALNAVWHLRHLGVKYLERIKIYFEAIMATERVKYYDTMKEQQEIRKLSTDLTVGTFKDLQVRALSDAYCEATGIRSTEEDMRKYGRLESSGAMSELERLLTKLACRKVEEAKQEYKSWKLAKSTGWEEPRKLSGSLWLDRLVKGALLTRDKTRARLYGSIKKDRPRMYETTKDTSVYLPKFDTMCMYPHMEAYAEMKYKSQQLGGSESYAELAAALVNISLLLDSKEEPEIALRILEMDAKADVELLTPTIGRLAETIYLKAKDKAKSDGSIPLSVVYRDVLERTPNAVNKYWVVREVLAILSVLNVSHTYRSRARACYSEALERVRERGRERVPLIDYDRMIQMTGVKVQRVDVNESGLTKEIIYIIERKEDLCVVLRCDPRSIANISADEKRYHKGLKLITADPPQKESIPKAHIEVIHLEDNMEICSGEYECFWAEAGLVVNYKTFF